MLTIIFNYDRNGPTSGMALQKGILGLPPNGKEFAITGVTIDRFIDGRISESLESWDAASLLNSLE
jgi:predicted ester cyclase